MTCWNFGTFPASLTSGVAVAKVVSLAVVEEGESSPEFAAVSQHAPLSAVDGDAHLVMASAAGQTRSSREQRPLTGGEADMVGDPLARRPNESVESEARVAADGQV